MPSPVVLFVQGAFLAAMANQSVSYSYRDTSQLEHACWGALSVNILNNPSGSALGIMQYYFVYFR